MHCRSPIPQECSTSGTWVSKSVSLILFFSLLLFIFLPYYFCMPGNPMGSCMGRAMLPVAIDAHIKVGTCHSPMCNIHDCMFNFGLHTVNFHNVVQPYTACLLCKWCSLHASSSHRTNLFSQHIALCC